MSDLQLFLLGTSILWGMLYYRRTGWACGGIITPGLLALNIAYPQAILFSIVSGTIISLVLDMLVRLFSLYGRQRIAVAMILAILLRMITLEFFTDISIWIGWVVPALIASDMERQGFAMTLCGVVSVTLVSLMTMESLGFLIMTF